MPPGSHHEKRNPMPRPTRRSGRDMKPTLQSTPSASARARMYETICAAPMKTRTAMMGAHCGPSRTK